MNGPSFASFRSLVSESASPTTLRFGPAGKRLASWKKNNPIDAQLLMKSGRSAELYLTAQKTPRQEEDEALVRRREQVLGLISREQNGLELVENKTIIKYVDQVLKVLKTPLKSLDQRIEKMLTPTISPSAMLVSARSMPTAGDSPAARRQMRFSFLLDSTGRNCWLRVIAGLVSVRGV